MIKLVSNYNVSVYIVDVFRFLSLFLHILLKVSSPVSRCIRVRLCVSFLRERVAM